jgi:hypothetical protein
MDLGSGFEERRLRVEERNTRFDKEKHIFKFDQLQVTTTTSPN